MLALSSSISNEVHIAFIIGFSARAIGSSSNGLVLISVEALRVLLSSSVSNFLSKEATIFSSVSAIVMRAPQFIIGRVLSWRTNTLTFWFMKTIEVECYHDVFSVLMDSVIFSIFIFDLSGVVISSIHQELLRCALRLLNDVSYENWHIRDLEFSPGLTLIPRVSNLGGGLKIRGSDNEASMVSKIVDQWD